MRVAHDHLHHAVARDAEIPQEIHARLHLVLDGKRQNRGVALEHLGNVSPGNQELVLEVRDARVPFSSINPTLEELIGNKARIVVFNKSDLISKKSQNIIGNIFTQMHGNQDNVNTVTNNSSDNQSVGHSIGCSKENVGAINTFNPSLSFWCNT